MSDKSTVHDIATPNNSRIHPYKDLEDSAFWNKIVPKHHPTEIPEWYKKKFLISNKKIATAGSCFAQHIGRHLRQSGFEFLDTEPAPKFLNPQSHMEYGYGIYSARYGNIYTTRQLLQLLQRALGEFNPKELFWQKDRGVVDQFRPTIEPEPFTDVEEMVENRKHHLNCVLELFSQTEVFIFTLGLTEVWVSIDDGAAYPMAPGVAGGCFDRNKYRFINLSHRHVSNDIKNFIEIALTLNRNMKFIFTVSPVPLMATATNHNVIVASSYSKSVLRAAAGFFADRYRYVDYFPSFEIISSHVMNSQFYKPDLRTITSSGVEHVMKHFFLEHKPHQHNKIEVTEEYDEDDIACDEELLASFGEK